jgi:hypothetical protein
MGVLLTHTVLRIFCARFLVMVLLTEGCPSRKLLPRLGLMQF